MFGMNCYFKIVLLSTMVLFTACSQMQEKEKSSALIHERIQKFEDPAVNKEELSLSGDLQPNLSIPKEKIKVGLILSGGGLKTYAHVGVLQELIKAKIPIHSVIGLEWGALIAAIYASKGHEFDVEWQMQKLKEEDLPEKSLLGSRISPVETEKLNGFFEQVFGSLKIGETKIKFSCPSQDLRNSTIDWKEKGLVVNALKQCLPYPPFFKPEGFKIAAPFIIDSAAGRLREQGMNIVIFVNVLEQGDIIHKERLEDEYIGQIMWAQGRRLTTFQRGYVDFIVGVHTREAGLLSYDQRKELTLSGIRAGADAAKRLIDQYGF